jgi:hypothetical protein
MDRHRAISLAAGRDGSWYTLADVSRVTEDEIARAQEAYERDLDLNPVGNPRELHGDELDAAQDAYERTHLGWD